MEAIKKLPYEKQIAFDKIKKKYKHDVEKQSKLFDFIKKSSIDQVHYLTKESILGTTIDIENRVNRRELKMEKYLINIRAMVNKKVIERLKREEKDLELIIERLLDFWSSYLLCDRCDTLI